MTQDFLDMLSALSAEAVEFLLVGAHALAAHRKARATEDMDIWVNPTPANAARVMRALRRFGAPLHDLTEEDLCSPDIVFQIGLPPNRIEILTRISGVEFADAWARKLEFAYHGIPLFVIGLEDLIADKRATGRKKDLGDVARLTGEED